MACGPISNGLKGFALILLFAAGHPRPIALLRERLAESLRLRTLRLTPLVPETSAAASHVAEAILRDRDGPGQGPLWVELWRNSTDAEWRRARGDQVLLRQLNERRFLLERDVKRPLILVLPKADRGRVYVEAPDLWAIRSFSAELLPTPENPAPRPTGASRASRVAPQSQPRRVRPSWNGRGSSSMPQIRCRVDPWDGVQGLSICDRPRRARVRPKQLPPKHWIWRAGDAPRSATRPQGGRAGGDLSVSLNNVGESVERDLGDLGRRARAAYRESLGAAPANCARRSARRPQALRDLSVSLNKVGDVERDLGDLEAARAAYRESLEVCAGNCSRGARRRTAGVARSVRLPRQRR